MIDFEKFFTFIQQGGLPALIAFILFTGYKEIWVWGKQAARQLAESKQREDEWKANYFRAAALVDRSADLVDRATAAVTVVASQQQLTAGRQ